MLGAEMLGAGVLGAGMCWDVEMWREFKIPLLLLVLLLGPHLMNYYILGLLFGVEGLLLFVQLRGPSPLPTHPLPTHPPPPPTSQTLQFTWGGGGLLGRGVIGVFQHSILEEGGIKGG